METLKLVLESGRFLVIWSWCLFHQAVESRLTRCNGRCLMQRHQGPITLLLCKLCSVGDLLWSALPCGERVPVMRVNSGGRPCGCGEEE